MSSDADPVKALREWAALGGIYREWIERELIEVAHESRMSVSGPNVELVNAARAVLAAAPALLARLEAGEGLLEDAEELLCTAASYLDAPGLEGDIREWRDRLAKGKGEGGEGRK